MRFSLFYNCGIFPGKEVSELYHEIEEQAIIADRLGFDAIWLANQHFEACSSTSSPFLHLARISSLTSSIELGTLVEAPYYHPLRLAEDIALLDILSGGRVRLGIGPGSINEWHNSAHCDISLDKKTARMLEMVAVLRQAFDEGCIDFLGNYYQYEGVELLAQPLQLAQQLIWITANNATPEIAGVAGYSLLMPDRGTANATRQYLDRYRAYLNGKSGFVSQQYFVSVASCEREAQAQMRSILARYTRSLDTFAFHGYPNGREYAALSRRLNLIIGTPSSVVEQLSAIQQEYGINEIVCQVYNDGMQHEDVVRSITLLGEEVLPGLQQLHPLESVLE
ncbi:monooxygenase [Dictyobacter alpinus]|uniref:Monooxygenase n=1 Tax=Dictyobacter alpinus TaxID=2014873 RepID=A0A402BFG6_9CHLR|nr:LLM class flavin-dependent oxidoreductase [Dictyobacter alpinus]GCE30020.1 monooxygenase [Dictyobacter alpinus]